MNFFKATYKSLSASMNDLAGMSMESVEQQRGAGKGISRVGTVHVTLVNCAPCAYLIVCLHIVNSEITCVAFHVDFCALLEQS